MTDIYVLVSVVPQTVVLRLCYCLLAYTLFTSPLY